MKYIVTVEFIQDVDTSRGILDYNLICKLNGRDLEDYAIDLVLERIRNGEDVDYQSIRGIEEI
jgi:hypothetical protein